VKASVQASESVDAVLIFSTHFGIVFVFSVEHRHFGSKQASWLMSWLLALLGSGGLSVGRRHGRCPALAAGLLVRGTGWAGSECEAKNIARAENRAATIHRWCSFRREETASRQEVPKTNLLAREERNKDPEVVFQGKRKA
jgi:hypothetical protein